MERKKDVTEAAAETRAFLRARWPLTKFSVRSKRYSGGSSVDVSWVDGPTQSEVHKATARFRGWDNGYYNEHGHCQRTESREAMQAAADAAALHYDVLALEVQGGDDRFFPHVADMRIVGSGGPFDHKEPIQDKIHRAARTTDLYGKKLMLIAETFEDAYPC